MYSDSEHGGCALIASSSTSVLRFTRTLLEETYAKSDRDSMSIRASFMALLDDALDCGDLEDKFDRL